MGISKVNVFDPLALNFALFTINGRPLAFSLEGYEDEEFINIVNVVRIFGGKIANRHAENTIVFTNPNYKSDLSRNRYSAKFLEDSIRAQELQELPEYRIKSSDECKPKEQWHKEDKNHQNNSHDDIGYESVESPGDMNGSAAEEVNKTLLDEENAQSGGTDENTCNKSILIEENNENNNNNLCDGKVLQLVITPLPPARFPLRFIKLEENEATDDEQEEEVKRGKIKVKDNDHETCTAARVQVYQWKSTMMQLHEDAKAKGEYEDSDTDEQLIIPRPARRSTSSSESSEPIFDSPLTTCKVKRRRTLSDNFPFHRYTDDENRRMVEYVIRKNAYHRSIQVWKDFLEDETLGDPKPTARSLYSHFIRILKNAKKYTKNPVVLRKLKRLSRPNKHY